MLDDEKDENLENEPTDGEVASADETDGESKKGSISADLIRGHINTIILRTLYEGDRYGYDIINEIEQKSHGQYSLKQPTLYSALKRLEAQGYVRAYWGGVSNGGRRRYFSLTDAGREVTEKNQAEWEYSRTVIDSLISSNDFDFSKPAPEPLDFRILTQSTSRTPIVEEVDITPISPIPQPIQPTQQAETVITPTSPVASTPAPATTTGQSTGIPLYMNRSEEERNYKDIVDRIYRSSIKETPSVEPATVSSATEPTSTENVNAGNTDATEPVVRYDEPEKQPIRPVSRGRIDFQDVEEQARHDGLRVWTSGAVTQKREMPEDFFNKGKTLLQASLIFLFFALAETILVALFRPQLGIEINYVIVMAICAIIPPIVCGVLRLIKYQPCCRRLKNIDIIYHGIVAFISAAMLLIIVDLILDVKFISFIAVLQFIIIPLVFLLNIMVFTTAYYFLSRSKV